MSKAETIDRTGTRWAFRSTASRSVDACLLHLPQTTEGDPKNPQHLVTAHGKGYILYIEGRPEEE